MVAQVLKGFLLFKWTLSTQESTLRNILSLALTISAQFILSE